MNATCYNYVRRGFFPEGSDPTNEFGKSVGQLPSGEIVFIEPNNKPGEEVPKEHLYRIDWE